MYGDFELNIRVFLFAAECIGKGAAFKAAGEAEIGYNRYKQ